MGLKEKIKNLPLSCGVYLMKDKKGKVLYVGKAANLRKRVTSHFYKNQFLPNKELLIRDIADIEYIICESEAKALILESWLIKEKRPKYNISLRDDKSFPLVEVTHEDFPRISITRKKKKAHTYFGPYPQAKDLKEALQLIRHIFGFRTCKSLPKKECLYFHLSLCPGPCIGRISKREYAKTVKIISLLLEGKRKDLIKVLKTKMNKAALKFKFEEASNARDKLIAVTSLYGIRREYQQLLLLKEALNLKDVPSRIEAIDISNIHAKQATGSVVVFENGVPLKSEYRRYKIKGKALDDVGMITEVIDRRIQSRRLNKERLSDLIIVDGGLSQANAAKKVLSKYRLTIPVIGIAKKKEEIWFPFSSKALKLGLNSPGLQVIQRLRNEAHRFAHKYHLYLRKKAAYDKG
jgi:excinuclease ABC subunit C